MYSFFRIDIWIISFAGTYSISDLTFFFPIFTSSLPHISQMAHSPRTHSTTSWGNDFIIFSLSPFFLTGLLCSLIFITLFWTSLGSSSISSPKIKHWPYICGVFSLDAPKRCFAACRTAWVRTSTLCSRDSTFSCSILFWFSSSLIRWSF